MVTEKHNVSKSHTWVHEIVSYTKCKSRIKKSRIIDLGAGLLIGYSRVYLFYYVFSVFSFYVYTKFNGQKSIVYKYTLIRYKSMYKIWRTEVQCAMHAD